MACFRLLHDDDDDDGSNDPTSSIKALKEESVLYSHIKLKTIKNIRHET